MLALSVVIHVHVRFVCTDCSVKPASEVQLEKDKFQQLHCWVQESLKKSDDKVHNQLLLFMWYCTIC